MPQNPLVLLSRQASFCAGLRLRHPNWTAQRNSQVYGRKIGPHGAEFHLKIALRGPVAPDDGMIVNLMQVKPQLAKVVEQLDQKFLDQEVEFFQSHRPTAENIARFCWGQMPKRVGDGVLHKLLLQQGRDVFVEILENSMKVCRCYEFAAAHRLFSPALSPAQNHERFDKCANLAGHGHNFQLSVWIEGTPNRESGFIINPQILDAIVDQQIYARFDHKHLNEDCPEFRDTGLVPTTENLALVIFDLLQGQLKKQGYKLARVGLQETQKNYFEVEA